MSPQEQKSKTCRRCKKTKEIQEFGVSRREPDSLNIICKECVRIVSRESRARKRAKSLPKQPNPYEKFEQDGKTYKKCKVCEETKEITEYRISYRKKRNKEEISSSCKECINKASREKHQHNKERNNARRREIFKRRYYTDPEYRERMLERGRKQEKKLREYRKKTRRERRGKDPMKRVEDSLRARVNTFVSGKNKSASTMTLVGCSLVELRKYLEARFQSDMTWDNYGHKGWHIDHIIPCAAFDLTDPEQQRKCFHYTNLQPLWWYQNLSKGSKVLDSSQYLTTEVTPDDSERESILLSSSKEEVSSQ